MLWDSLWFLQPSGFRYMIIPAALCAAGLLFLAHRLLQLRQPRGKTRLAGQAVPIYLVAQFVFVFLLWLMWQTLGHVALQPDYFAHPLILPPFLAWAA